MAPPSRTISAAGDAVAHIAYLCSDVILSVRSDVSSPDEFSAALDGLVKSETPTALGNRHVAVPDVLSVASNTDPFLSTFAPLRSHKLVAVTASSSVLLQAIPHLYKLAQYPIVIHISLEPRLFPSYSDITAIRQTGFTFLQSETLQEAYDIALSAHALALQTGKGVVHFFHSALLENDRPVQTYDNETVFAVLNSKPGFNASESQDTEDSLYAENGASATIVRSGNDSLDHLSSSDGTSLKSYPLQDFKSITTNSSTGSSHRESSTESGHSASSATSIESSTTHHLTSNDILHSISGIWAQIKARTGHEYQPFEYSGPKDAKTALFIFGGDAGLFGDAIDSAKEDEPFTGVGLVTVRLYRPWLAAELSKSIPTSVKKLGVVEQVSQKTTKWSPVFLDLLTSLNVSQTLDAVQPVAFRLGHVNAATIVQALRGICQNLALQKPVQNLEVGSTEITTQTDKAAQVQQPKVENAYMKILEQTFNDRLFVANAADSQHAGISPAISLSPEFGFGSLLARLDRRQNLIREAENASKSDAFVTEIPKSALSRWALHANDRDVNNYAQAAVDRLAMDGSPKAAHFLQQRQLFFSESSWLIGSDSWAYDLSNSGVHHVIASGKNINMLIIDSQPYSERAAADAARRKKDIGLYAMNFGNVYVGSVAVYSSYTQVLQTMIEADKFEGPSIVLAYLPYTKPDESPLKVLQETKKAVDSGYWPLYRWNPSEEEANGQRFQLDSERIKLDLETFLRRDNHLTQLTRKTPQFSANLAGSVGSEIRHLQKRRAKDAYSKLLEGLYGAPLTILFASDNGNSESLSKRLGSRGKARGLKTMVFAMDDYPIEDLAQEENVVLLTSTAGQGEFPQNGRAFWEAIKDNTDLDLSTTNFSVFALGDSHYWPRKEDKIYYNKPGKDLDVKLAFLGGKRLAPIGLGDDQDPDTYQTGYAEWEPKLWQALGVDNVEGLPDEPPPITNEDIKIESNYLRGTIAEGLEDTTTGAISAADQQLTKFHGTYMQDDRDLRDERKAQGLEPAYSFMIRCRLPGGVATPKQWIQMDDVCNSFGNETMKLTTRQTFQFHGVVKGKLKSAMQGINRALMTTIAACGDVNRNVMCSSLPEHSKYHEEVHTISRKISNHLLPSTTAYHEIWLQEDGEKKTQIAGDALVDFEPLYGPTYLPRKFKITIAIPPHNDTDVYAHDVGLIAIKGKDGNLEGFNVLAGGGMGVTHNNKKTYPRTGSMLGYVVTDKVHLACEKIMLVQRDHGDRKNRKHARLKYTMDDMGVDVFRGKVEELLGFSFEKARPFKFASNIDTFGWQRDETGKNHFTFFIENGRIEDTAAFPMKTGLREIAKVHKGEFRLTGNQHLILSNVTDADLPQMKSLLAKYKLDNVQFSALRLSSSACVAFPTCGLAMAESERYLPELITKLEGSLEENGLRQESIVMRMTGCPNGCARPWLAEVAFVGKAYGAYNMYLGGGYHGQRLNKLYRSSIKEDEILAIMKPLLKRYAIERKEGERFGDFVIRIGMIKETTEGKYFHDDTAEAESENEE